MFKKPPKESKTNTTKYSGPCNLRPLHLKIPYI